MTTNKETFDYLIIGAGPAGLQLGYFLEKANRNYLVLEAGKNPGTFFKKYPIHRKLISINKVYTGYDNPEINLRWDWNSLLSDSEEMLFKNYSKRYFPGADNLVQYLNDFAHHFDIKIQYDTQIVKISKKNNFQLTDSDGNSYSCERLIIATGAFKSYIPQIPGIELAENYVEVSTNADEFINQKVLIIGKGNSAFETADHLTETASVIHVASPNPLNLAWKTHYVGNLRAVNNNFLDTYQLKTQNAVLDATIKKISYQDKKFIVSVSYTHADDEKEDIIYDRVIVCTGFRFDDSIFDESCRPEMVINNRFPNQTSEWESTNIKNLYFAGALMQMRDFKKSSSAFIHGFRYNIKALHKILEYKYYNIKWQTKVIDSTSEAIVNAAIKRINISSALWQQFGFLCDCITVSDNGKSANYYEEIPVDYLHISEIGQHIHYYIITLEFGKIDGDPFNISRYPKPNQAKKSTFIHPVIRRFSKSKLISEYHVLEDLDGEWIKNEIHIKPLLKFFDLQLIDDSKSTFSQIIPALPKSKKLVQESVR
ncbi:MAG: NAD(P)-binding domain-containing protein [Rivularia sp. (in: cyanobacteria)]